MDFNEKGSDFDMLTIGDLLCKAYRGNNLKHR